MSFSGDQTHEAEIPREWSVSQVPWDPSHECQFLPVVASPSTHNTWYLTTLPEHELRPRILLLTDNQVEEQDQEPDNKYFK